MKTIFSIIPIHFCLDSLSECSLENLKQLLNISLKLVGVTNVNYLAPNIFNVFHTDYKDLNMYLITHAMNIENLLIYLNERLMFNYGFKGNTILLNSYYLSYFITLFF